MAKELIYSITSVRLSLQEKPPTSSSTPKARRDRTCHGELSRG
jgi:hypothetical protein